MTRINIHNNVSSPLLRGKMSDRWNRRYETVDDAIRDANWDAVGLLLRSDGVVEMPDYVSYEIGVHGRYVQLLLDRGINRYDVIAQGAAYGGHLDIVKQMIVNGDVDYNWAAYQAATKGHVDIVDLMLANGADDHDIIAYAATMGGHNDILNKMLELGLNDPDWVLGSQE